MLIPESLGQRYHLFSDYLDELWLIKEVAPLSKPKKELMFSQLMSNDTVQWMDININEESIGFLIIGTAPNCHPEADYYIIEAYVKPEYRNQGHMSKTTSEYLSKHRGVYCLFIINKNTYAQEFWKHIFSKHNYQPCVLCDIGAEDDYCTQYGFLPDELTLM